MISFLDSVKSLIGKGIMWKINKGITKYIPNFMVSFTEGV